MMKVRFFVVLTISVSCLSAYAMQGDFVYDSKANRDPFVPLVSKDGVRLGSWQKTDAVGDITLEGIVWDPQGEPMAIVNGNIVKEGDTFLNLEVLEIRKEGIRLLKGDKELIINLVTEEGGG